MSPKFWNLGEFGKISRSVVLMVTFVGLVMFILAFFFYREYGRVNREAITSWEGSPEALASVDCGVVLTGSAGRVREGFALLANHQIKKLIISGVYPQAEIQNLFVYGPFYGNLNVNDVILEKKSTTTYGNAQQTQPLVRALKCRGILLITSQLHMYRAYRTFRGTFGALLPIYKQTIPRSQSETGTWEIWTEVGKSLFYSLWAYF